MKVFSATLLGLLGSFVAALPAAAAEPEHRLSGAEIRDLAKREVLWCDDYHRASDDCSGVTVVRLLPDGRVTQTTTILVSESPRLQAYIGDIDKIEGDRVCGVVKAADTQVSFTLDGKAVPELAGLRLKAVLLSVLAELEGKTMCQSFFRGGDKNRLREEVTVDGARRKDLESTYVIRDGKDGFALRPQITDKDDDTGKPV
jgi:hypothetical protein